MTDVRRQLTEALDRAEKLARALLVEAHAWPAIEAMCGRELRLIEGYREMLDEHRDDRPGWQCACSPSLPCRELRRAAAFWLGTPEVDHG